MKTLSCLVAERGPPVDESTSADSIVQARGAEVVSLIKFSNGWNQKTPVAKGIHNKITANRRNLVFLVFAVSDSFCVAIFIVSTSS